MKKNEGINNVEGFLRSRTRRERKGWKKHSLSSSNKVGRNPLAICEKKAKAYMKSAREVIERREMEMKRRWSSGRIAGMLGGGGGGGGRLWWC